MKVKKPLHLQRSSRYIHSTKSSFITFNFTVFVTINILLYIHIDDLYLFTVLLFIFASSISMYAEVF